MIRRRHEFRVVWKREGKARRAVVVAKLSTADRLAEKQAGMDSDDFDDERVVPPLEYIYIEQRPIGAWRKVQ